MKSDFNMFCLFLVKDRFKETEYKTVFNSLPTLVSESYL